MKKTIFVFLIALLTSAFCFAQSMSAQARALQGTWILIGIMNDKESYDEAAIKAEKIDISYVFNNNNVTVKKYTETYGPIRFDAISGFIYLRPGDTDKFAYNLQGNILIIHESGNAYIYRKR